MMSLEEAIKHAEEVALEQIRLMGRYDAASGYARSRNESIRTESAKECEKCAAEHKQLAAWLRELKERREEPKIIRCCECEHSRVWGCELYCTRWVRYTSHKGYCHRGEERRTE